MSQNMMGLLQGQQNVQTVQVSSDSASFQNMSTGDLVPGKIQTIHPAQNGTRVSLQVNGATAQFQTTADLTPGSVVLTRVESIKDNLRLSLLQKQSEVKKITTQELLNLVEKLNISSDEDTLKQVRSQLNNRGVIDPTRLKSVPQNRTSNTTPQQAASESKVTSSAGDPISGTILKFGGETESLSSLQTGEDVALRTVGDSQNGKVKVRIGNNEAVFEAKTPTKLQGNLQLQGKVIESDGQVKIQITSSQSMSKPDTSKRIKQLMSQLKIEQTNQNQQQLRQLIINNKQNSLQQILERIQNQFQTSGSKNNENVRTTIRNIVSSLSQTENSSRNLLQAIENVNRSQLQSIIRELGFDDGPRTTKLAQTVVETDPNPTKKTLQAGLKNLNLIVNDSGEIDQNKLKSLLFLAKNDLPVNSDVVNQLQNASFEQGQQTSSQTFDSMQTALSGNEENLAQKMQQVVQNMGFDLEKTMIKQTDQAKQSTRSVLMKAFGSDGSVNQGMLESSNQAPSNSTDAKSMLSQVVKHSLGSISQDGEIFIFVPFEDDGKTKLMQVQFRDEREDGEDIDEERWNFTIDLNLSKLGSIQVQARRHDMQLQVQFKVDESDTLHRIRRSSRTLEEILMDKGYDVAIQTERMEPDRYDLIDRELYFAGEEQIGVLDLTV